MQLLNSLESSGGEGNQGILNHADEQGLWQED
jgi:hypothetical protein